MITGIVIVSTIVVIAIKKPKAKKPRETFEKELQDLELTRIKGIGSKRAKELKAASINTFSDLATSSAKDLSQKTGISEKTISRWIHKQRKKSNKNSSKKGK